MNNWYANTIEVTFVEMSLALTYSHSQWLFYTFANKITNELVKQSLRVTVGNLQNQITTLMYNCTFYLHIIFTIKTRLQ